MRVGDVRIAEEEDFSRLKELCQRHDGWRQDYNKNGTNVWTKANDVSDFKMVKIRGTYTDLTAAAMYDVLHDPVYRKTWDPNLLEGHEICRINGNNDIGYYAMKLPKPLANRDFVTQRSWRDLGKEKVIFNHSINHASMPPRKSIVRGISYLTGYHIIATNDDPLANGCQVTYVTQSDPKGRLPVWAVNKATQYLAPKVMHKLHKACLAYNEWKSQNRPEHKPWLFPEQSTLPLLNPADILQIGDQTQDDTLDETEVTEEQVDVRRRPCDDDFGLD